MFDLGELYQEIILDHNRSPRNQRALPAATHQAEGYNPLCGDRVRVQLRVADGRVAEVAFEGQGCAISQASASVMTEALTGLPVDEADTLFCRMVALLTGQVEIDETDDLLTELGSAAAFAGVRDFPSRVKCATLAWHAMHQALAEGAADAGPSGSKSEAASP